MEASLPTRRLIPKWRQVRRALATHEATAGLAQPSSNKAARSPKSTSDGLVPAQVDFDEFENAVALWKKFKEPGVFGDIISFSLEPSLQQRIIDLGRQAIDSGDQITQSQRFMIKHLAGSHGEGRDLVLPEPGDRQKDQFQPFAGPIRALRELLRTDPSNPLALLDFAQLQAAIGRNEVAERSLRSALGLAPNNRLVLRTLARFYVHAGEPEQAHHLLKRHQRTPHDPWLISSEIALADLAGTGATFLAKGRRMLVEAGKSPSANFTELAGSIAMVELGAGNLKKARDFQRIALLDPTDNVVAQAVDRQRQFGIALNAPKVERAIAGSAEAKMLQSWLSVLPEAVEAHALQWHNEEPFSSRPVQMLTALFAFKGDTQRALNWLRVGLRSDGDDMGLLLNLAYVQARSGLADQARLTVLRARRLGGHEEQPYLLGTEGAIAYSIGQFDEGDQFYAQAVAMFDAPDRYRQNLSTYCLLNQAIIALEQGHPRGAELVARTNDALQKRPNPDAAMLLKVVTAGPAVANAAVDHPPQEQPVHRPRLTSQWVFDRKTNTLTERRGLTAPGAKPIVLAGNRESDT